MTELIALAGIPKARDLKRQSAKTTSWDEHLLSPWLAAVQRQV